MRYKKVYEAYFSTKMKLPTTYIKAVNLKINLLQSEWTRIPVPETFTYRPASLFYLF